MVPGYIRCLGDERALVSHNRYAVICAAHTGNSGMYSVDEAARHFFGQRDADYTLFVAQKDKRGNFDSYEFLTDLKHLDSYTHIVYWGDFLNNPAYGYQDFARRSKKWGLAKTHAEAVVQWKRVFSPRSAIPGVKIYSVGSNFQHNFAEVTPKATHLLKRLERSFEKLYLRDTFSFQNLTRHVSFPNIEKVALGMDCAFLQEPPIMKNDEDISGTFAYYFRRSKLKDTSRLIRILEETTGLQGVELKSWIPLPTGRWEDSFNALKGEINRSSFVLTDTYHVCVNAMHSRRPVVGVGRQRGQQVGTLGDFKKRVLFEMFDLGRFYYELDAEERDSDAFESIVETVHQALGEQRRGANPLHLVEARTREFSRKLERDLGLLP